MTEQQKLAAEDQDIKIQELLNLYLTGKKELGLFGVGGTGKTQSVITLIERILDVNPNLSVGGAAISHSAKNVLQKRFDESLPIVQCKTIASMLRLKRTITNDGEIQFLPSKETITDDNGKEIIIRPPIYEYDIVVIDECSQISPETKKMIDDEKHESTVIIYLGDWHQTPPVSKDRTSNEDSPTFLVPNRKLIIPFRYEGKLQYFAEAIAEEIDNCNRTGSASFSFLKKFYNEHSDSYKFYRDKNQFVNDYIKEVKSSSNIKNTTFISYRNDTTTYYSNLIRSKVVDSKKPYCVGDVLVCKRRMDRGGDTVESTNVENAQIYKVTNIEEYDATVVFSNGSFSTIYTGYSSFTDNFIKFTTIRKKQIPIYLLTLVDFDGVEYLNIPVLKDPMCREYLETLVALKSIATTTLESKNWAKYYSFYEYFGHFEYAYAVNTHIVQGDTYNNVFINMADILNVKPTSNKEKLQSLYTAVTRARNNVSLLI